MGRSDPDLDDAREVLTWITKHGQPTFTRRDALRALQGRTRFSTAADLDPALTLLTDHGHIRPKTPEKSSKGGRPSTAYEVHPDALRAP
ncbi:hypothetical protein [Kribbella sp. CA-247076]|uniref:hypothetical protein n=1 Tax=Kribbella sp. CA-247076 TaxID=3239941 RepID=UPI003D8D5151